MSKKHNPTNAKPGSTRKELTEAEKDWLKNFDQAFYNRDEKSLAKIVPKDHIVTDVIKEMNDADNAKRNDIFQHQKAVHVKPSSTSSWDETFDSFIEGDDSVDHYIEDPTLDPVYPAREKKQRYTSEDYNPPSFPDEDTIILAIDHDREELEKKKVKNIKEFIEKYKQARKKYDPAS